MPERVEADVCIVGAGYAGLTTARRLTQHGKTVSVVEARDRVGGRIWTEPLSDGTPIDRGGAWLAPKHDAMFGLTRELGVATYKTWVKGAHLLADGERIRRYTGLIPKISPAAIVTIALAQWKLDRMAKAGSGRGAVDRQARARVGCTFDRLVDRAFGDSQHHRPRPVRDGGARPVSG